MLKNYLKIAVRILLKQKLTSFVTIGSLAVGFTFFILTYVYVVHELSYDRFHRNGKDIYRLCRKNVDDRFFELVSARMRTPLQENVSGIKHITRIRNDEYKIKIGDIIFKDRIVFVDSDFLNMFSFPLIAGNPDAALKNNHSIVLTEKVARKYFGDLNAIGKTLSINLGDYYSTGQFEDFIVTGITEDIPSNSSFQFDIILPFNKIITGGNYSPSLLQYDTQIFLQLENDKNVADVERQFPAFFKNYIRKSEYKTDEEIHLFALQPLFDIHFNEKIADYGVVPQDKTKFVYIILL